MQEQLEAIAKECGFEFMGVTEAAQLKTMPEVRDMCASGTCQIYGHSWACPPACGTVEEYQEKISQFENCLVVQTLGELEDEFDFETIMETEHEHKRRFTEFAQRVHELEGETLLLAAGTCTLCKTCTYPDAPCRFPEKRMSSMEAAGLVVADVCTLAGIPYNHGKNTMAFSSCVLF